uniref:Uncharacterized protein n=1 Tax=Avena sativa TaxID=4498 RepID=A0ACD5VUA0_AVESA
MSCRRPSSPSPVPVVPLEDDNLLDEILLRLPPQPPYLLRASLVSKRWRRIATDPQFLRRFHVHHRKPPVLGVFSCVGRKISFTFRSTLDPPYRIPRDRFSLSMKVATVYDLLDCRHGRVLIINRDRRQVTVWDPITGDRSLVAVPPEFNNNHIGAVLCAAGDQGHVHGACHSIPFKLVVLSSYEHGDEAGAFASVYSSETGVWSEFISIALPQGDINFSGPGTLVGNTLYWLLRGSRTSILEFDLDRQSLAVIKRPHSVDHSVQIIRAEDGGLGLAILACPRYHPLLQIWERKINSYGAAIWVLRKTVELEKILGLRFRIDKFRSAMVQYVEDVHAIVLLVHTSAFMVQLDSMQSREIHEHVRSYYHFTSFYTQGLEVPCSSLKQK